MAITVLNTDPLKKRDNENEQQYLWRVGGLIDQGKFANWDAVLKRVNEELYDSDVARYKGESAFRKDVASARKFYEAGVFASTTDDTLKQLREERDRLYAAKRELADQKREYNGHVLKEARFENLTDYLLEAVQKMSVEVPLTHPLMVDVPVISVKEAVLFLTDWHYGMVTDNIWNRYNTEICKARVKETIEKTVEYLKLFDVRKLHVVAGGDLIQGAIHLSCRVASEENTCDQLIHVSELLAEVLDELSGYVGELHFYSCYGNHARVIQKKEDSVHSDNFEVVVPWWIKERLSNNPRITVHTSEYKEFTVVDVLGYNICCVHGDLDNIKTNATTINTMFNRKFGKSIDYLVCGDKHHLEEFEDTGIETVIVRSLCGTDEYANNKRLYSYPGQTLMIFNKDEGRECTRNIKLH